MSPAPPGLVHFRSVFISDIHLGTKTSQPDALLEFLKVVECEKLYLAADVVVDCVAIDALSRLKDNDLLCVKPL